jgi:hypothetical protein
MLVKIFGVVAGSTYRELCALGECVMSCWRPNKVHTTQQYAAYSCGMWHACRFARVFTLAFASCEGWYGAGYGSRSQALPWSGARKHLVGYRFLAQHSCFFALVPQVKTGVDCPVIEARCGAGLFLNNAQRLGDLLVKIPKVNRPQYYEAHLIPWVLGSL